MNESNCFLNCHFKDMLVPIADLKASIELFHREVIYHQSLLLPTYKPSYIWFWSFFVTLSDFILKVAIYPIWLCPFKLPAHPGMLKPHTNKVTLDSWIVKWKLSCAQQGKNVWFWLVTFSHPSRKRCLWMLESTVCPRMIDLTLKGQPGRLRSLSGQGSHQW